ncbi:MAG TPA: hypothetical protein DD438_05190 [Verrucomicrobiales bacterium]|nr:hypothetical protein [Verrucomicrobiales bacterium]
MLLVPVVPESLKIKSMKSPLMFLLTLYSACFGDLRGESLKPGSNRVKLVHEDPREMLVRLPADYDPDKRYPVVFGFHGAGGPMEGYHRQLEPLVRDHGYISVSPQGLSNGPRNRRAVAAWNGFENHRLSRADDVGFVKKAIEYLGKHASIDRQRLYATGGSSGAIFCFRLAMETDLFAAIAPMRGAMIKRPPIPSKRPKVSILMVCGTEDGLFTGESKVPGELFYPAHETMGLWSDNHGSKAEPVVMKQTEEIRLTRYSPEKSGYELLLYALRGSGHRVPRERMSGAIDYMAHFFSKQTKPPSQSH